MIWLFGLVFHKYEFWRIFEALIHQNIVARVFPGENNTRVLGPVDTHPFSKQFVTTRSVLE